jgi:uncharacterized cysteine cluster protein YcgN (CxxCxxCC family)
MSDNRPFYERKSLSEMSDSEWESLCDGCGKCCVVILGDEDDPDTFWRTNVGCKLLDLKTVRCSDYAQPPDPCARLREAERKEYRPAQMDARHLRLSPCSMKARACPTGIR